MGSDRATGRRSLALAVIYVAAYLLLEWGSNVRPQLAPGITLWNPQAGLTLAFLLMASARWWPLTAAAACLAELTVRQVSAPVLPILTSSLWVGAAYGTLAAILRHWELSAPIRTMVAAARLATLAILGTLGVAAGYVGLFVAFGAIDQADALAGIARYWVADLNGVLPLAPLLLYARDWAPRLQAIRRYRWEVAATLGAVAGMLWIIFLLPAADQLRFFHLLFLPIIWIALRWRWPGAMLAAGLQHREIAERLAISARTVEVYKARMMEKLQCRTLAEVVRIGTEALRNSD